MPPPRNPEHLAELTRIASKMEGTYGAGQYCTGEGEARRDDLVPGSGAQGAGFAMHVSLSARSVEALADACAVVEECLGTDLDIEDVSWLDPDQSSAAATCWPVARGMRPVGENGSARIRKMLAGKGNKEALT